MKTGALMATISAVALAAAWTQHSATGQTAMLPAPGFHHLHLNSTNPDAAIDFYTRQFPSTSKGTWGGMPALKSPNNVMVLFTKVDIPPPTQPATAIWHFGWHVTDQRKTVEVLKTHPEVRFLPLFTTDEGGSVLVSSDTWPGTGGVLGLTKAQIADARAKGVKPAGGGGFTYIQGPDGAIIEVQGDRPQERFNHVHMWQEDPFCAQIWYRTHLSAALPEGATLRPPTNCKVPRSPDTTWPALEREGMYRTPTARVTFGDVDLPWYMNQTDKPLASTRGQLADQIGLSVADLDAWVLKLRGEGVKILKEPYKFGDARAVMIEGPSREQIVLVEVK